MNHMHYYVCCMYISYLDVVGFILKVLLAVPSPLGAPSQRYHTVVFGRSVRGPDLSIVFGRVKHCRPQEAFATHPNCRPPCANPTCCFFPAFEV